MNSLLLDIGLNLGANGLPYELPIHPTLVHLTLGLFIIAVIFDIAGNLFPLERPLFKVFAITAIRSGFYDVGWYNLLAAAVITIFTVAAGFFEIMLANRSATGLSAWGLNISHTMILHGLSGILLLGVMIGMTVWRGFQRYLWRKESPRQVQWSYLLVGLIMFGLLFVQGTLGAQLGDEFGVHNTAAGLLRQGQNPAEVLK
ncbi:MAG: DUF2231 domain-containing protein [Coleofasciculaceae cyanobacterium]